MILRVPGRRPALLSSVLASIPALGSAQQQVPPPVAQQPGAPGEVKQAPPVVVTATRTAVDPFAAPRTVDVISAEQLQRDNRRTLPQALRELPSVLVQETAPGQGSPYVRGFTGYQNLLLIDGVRLNNSTFRSGPNQYWSTVDTLSLERIEVLKGPASALYGSDAIGGTVQVFTKSPDRYHKDGFAYGGGLQARYATAEDSLIARGEFEAGQTWADGSRTGFLLGADAKSFGTLEGGSDTGNQLNTEHDETVADVKVEHWFDSRSRLVFLHQQYDQDNVPRTHATIYGESFRGTTVGTDLQRDLDQQRSLTYLQYHSTGLGGAVDGMHLSLSYQVQHELEDRITSANVERWQAFTVGTVGMFAQFDTDAGAYGTLTYGIDYYHDNVNSWFRRSSGTSAADPIQGQVGNDASYDLFGAFVQDLVAFGDRTELQLGLRYTYAAADADSVRDPSTNQKVALQDDWDELTASAHLRHDLVAGRWNVYGGVSQGFRAPSLADLTLFDTARSGEVEVPSPGLDAEHYVGYEIGTKVRTPDWTAIATYYYTDIEDQIQRYPTGTTIGSSAVITKSNVGSGYVHGAELQLGWEFVEQTTLFGSGSWQYGRVTNYDQSGQLHEEFPSRLMPLTALVGLRWEDASGRFHAETHVLHVEDADKTSAGDNRDTQRIPPGGAPGYTIWNLRCGVQVSDRSDVELAVENITDVDYRVHGSGSNMPGTNFVIGMRTEF